MIKNASGPGAAGHDRISADQEHEVQALARKYRKSVEMVRIAIRAYGPMRSRVEARL